MTTLNQDLTDGRGEEKIFNAKAALLRQGATARQASADAKGEKEGRGRRRGSGDYIGLALDKVGFVGTIAAIIYIAPFAG